MNGRDLRRQVDRADRPARRARARRGVARMICEQASDVYRWNANPNTPTPTPSATKIKSATQNSIGLMKTGHTRERSIVSVLMRLPISLSQSLLGATETRLT